MSPSCYRDNCYCLAVFAASGRTKDSLESCCWKWDQFRSQNNLLKILPSGCKWVLFQAGPDRPLGIWTPGPRYSARFPPCCCPCQTPASCPFRSLPFLIMEPGTQSLQRLGAGWGGCDTGLRSSDGGNLGQSECFPKGSAARLDFTCQNKQQGSSGNTVFLSSSKTSLSLTFNVCICDHLPVAQKFCFRQIFAEWNSCNRLLW